MVLTLGAEKPRGSLRRGGDCDTPQWPRNIELPAELSEYGASDEESAASSYQPGNYTSSFSTCCIVDKSYLLYNADMKLPHLYILMAS